MHAENVERIRAAAGPDRPPGGDHADLPGPSFESAPCKTTSPELRSGDLLVLQGGSSEIGNSEHMSVTWAGLAGSVDPTTSSTSADGAIRLRVKRIREGDGEVETKVEIGGAVASRQGINIPGNTRGLAAVPEEDLEMLRFGESIGVDLVALSSCAPPRT